MTDEEARDFVAYYDETLRQIATKRRVATIDAKTIVQRECAIIHSNYLAALRHLEPQADAVARSDKEATLQWNRAIADKMRGGATRMQANIQIARANPSLHRAFLVATNRGRSAVGDLEAQDKPDPLAETHQQVVEAFDELVAAKVATGLTRQTAIASVVKNHPRLHELYLVATNRDRPAAVAHLT